MGIALAGAGLGLALVSATAQAGTITFNNETFDGGTGFGNVLTLTTIHGGTDNVEWGGIVGYDATDGDLFPDDLDENATDDTVEGNPHTLTRTVGEIIDLGWESGQDVGIVFNLSETGSEQTLQLYQFIVYGFDADGDLIDTWTFNSDDATNGDTFDEEDQGGGNSGFLFRLTDVQDFMATSTNRFGLLVPENMLITNSDGGNETFYITNVESVSVVPLPPAVLIGLGMMGGMGALRLRRRRRLTAL